MYEKNGVHFCCKSAERNPFCKLEIVFKETNIISCYQCDSTIIDLLELLDIGYVFTYTDKDSVELLMNTLKSKN